jgi:hypothetical protein
MRVVFGTGTAAPLAHRGFTDAILPGGLADRFGTAPALCEWRGWCVPVCAKIPSCRWASLCLMDQLLDGAIHDV